MSRPYNFTVTAPSVGGKRCTNFRKWLICFLGNADSQYKQFIDSNRNRPSCYMHTIKFFPQALISVGNKCGVDPLAEFDAYVLQIIRREHASMPLSAPVAIVIDRNDCCNDDVFDLIVSSFQRPNGYFYYFCSNSRALSAVAPNCLVDYCCECQNAPSQCQHTCYERLVRNTMQGLR